MFVCVNYPCLHCPFKVIISSQNQKKNVISKNVIFYLCQGGNVCTLHKNYLPDFYDSWWEGVSRAKEEPIKLWSRSGSRGRLPFLPVPTGRELFTLTVGLRHGPDFKMLPVSQNSHRFYSSRIFSHG